MRGHSECNLFAMDMERDDQNYKPVPNIGRILDDLNRGVRRAHVCYYFILLFIIIYLFILSFLPFLHESPITKSSNYYSYSHRSRVDDNELIPYGGSVARSKIAGGQRAGQVLWFCKIIIINIIIIIIIIINIII